MRRDWELAGGERRPPPSVPWLGECGHPGCPRTPGPDGLCAAHRRRYEELGMDVRPGWHVRSLRMPKAEAAAIVEAVRRLNESRDKRISQQEFIRQCVRYVVREAGIAVPEPVASEIEEDPFQ